MIAYTRCLAPDGLALRRGGKVLGTVVNWVSEGDKAGSYGNDGNGNGDPNGYGRNRQYRDDHRRRRSAEFGAD
jgi:hypothetical protein